LHSISQFIITFTEKVDENSRRMRRRRRRRRSRKRKKRGRSTEVGTTMR